LADIHITDLESAINYWREREPSPDGVSLPSSTRALAQVYARMAVERATLVDEGTLTEDARAAWLQWYATTPDTPCIAICSTSQGDAVCKGCGRTFDEVQHWLAMGPADKRSVWRRITAEGTALRFTRYAERAVD